MAQHSSGRVVPAIALVAALTTAFGASALSRRDQQAVDAINARMAAAEAAYREALVDIGNADPGGQQAADAALEDMEDAVLACNAQRGCETSTLLAAYKRLLKSGADDLFPGEPPGSSVATATVPQAGAAHAGVPADGSLYDAGQHRFDEMVEFNPAVRAGIRRWLTDMRPQLLDSYVNYQYLRAEMAPHFERAGLPEALLFGILAKESNGKVHARSRAGAAGPMQFMHATGKRFGLGVDATGFDTRYDPGAAAEASAAYLNERMAELGGSVELALAGYNGGEGRARRVFQSSGGRGFWDADVYRQFPAETRDYVPMVIAAAWLYLHPDEYGLDFDRVYTRPAKLALRKPATIYELTICLGNRGTRDGYMRTLRNLNPRYHADSWLPAGTTLNATTRIASLYARYCVQGPRAALAQQLVQSDAEAAIVQAP